MEPVLKSPYLAGLPVISICLVTLAGTTPSLARDNSPGPSYSCACTCYVPANESPDHRVHRGPQYGYHFGVQGYANGCAGVSDMRGCSVEINGQSVTGRIDGSECRQTPSAGRPSTQAPLFSPGTVPPKQFPMTPGLQKTPVPPPTAR